MKQLAYKHSHLLGNYTVLWTIIRIDRLSLPMGAGPIWYYDTDNSHYLDDWPKYFQSQLFMTANSISK